MDSTARTRALTRDECIEKARHLAPRFAERSERTEAQRRLTEETVEDLVESGLVRTLLPERYGGSELDFDVVFSVCLELGPACAATAWVGSFFMNHAWVVGLFPRAAQDEVWKRNPDALIATRVSFQGNHIARVSDGYFLSGRWSQTSGVEHTEWMALCANDASSEAVETLFCLVPNRELRIEDTWFATGLRGSCSQTVIAENGSSGEFVGQFRPASGTSGVSATAAGAVNGSLARRLARRCAPVTAPG
jgi:3-hydroxy-9,10-secoandrosta-1,3,5(10)-triene-9,17-dione monooxygenase